MTIRTTDLPERVQQLIAADQTEHRYGPPKLPQPNMAPMTPAIGKYYTPADLLAKAEPAMTLVLHLPFPPSLNHAYPTAKNGRRIESKESKAYKSLVAIAVIRAGRPSIKGRFHIHLTLAAPDNRPRDGNNLWKCLMDALVDAGVIEDDSNRYSRRELLEWTDGTIAGGGATVVIQEAKP